MWCCDVRTSPHLQRAGALTNQLPRLTANRTPSPITRRPSPVAIMINAVLVFNNAGQPRLTKFYTQLV